MIQLVLLLSTVVHSSFAFQPRHIHQHLSVTSSSVSAALGGDGGEIMNDEDEMKRMDIVRMLQRSYYRSDDTNKTTTTEPYKSRRPALDVDTGRILNLPLWRVGWVETPGRRNCLNVHELQYTHMFETILSSTSDNDDDDNGPPPLYFGHLYLPGGTSSALSGEERYRLKTWREELMDIHRFEDYTSSSTLAVPDLKSPTVNRSAVIGCLMQILDHRRLDDGRLVILVQAVERFVVEEIVKTRPYAVANVQILLDKEELPWEEDYSKTSSNDGTKKQSTAMDDEGICKVIRRKAVAASFCYHEYEFDKQKLPGGDGNGNKEMYLTKEDVPWIQISQLLPFAQYSSNDQCLVVANAMTAHIMDDAIFTDSNDIYVRSVNGDLPIEQELWNGGILWEPPRVLSTVDHGRRDDLDCDALETLLWLALEEFCRGTGFVLSHEVGCLMPPEMDYLDFTTSKCLSLSMNYPKRRRQRRLSFLAPAIIENVVLPMKGRRQIWLNAPSTAARLLDTLEWYDYLNNKIGLGLMGEFE